MAHLARILIFSFLILCATSSLRAASGDVSGLHRQLSNAEEAGDRAAIIEPSRRIVAMAPNDSGAWEMLLRTQFEAEDFDGAAKSLDLRGIHWVIVNGESGPHARTMNIQWVREIFRECRKQKVPFFFKQWGGVRKDLAGRLLGGRTYDEMPDRVAA
jgi:phage protein Gp37/Gp68